MIFAPRPRRLAAHDLAFAGLLPFVSHVLIRTGRPFTPPFALIWPIRTLAAASAGPSNGAIAPVLSNAQPITIGACAVVVLPPSPVPTAAIATVRTATSAPSAPHRFL